MSIKELSTVTCPKCGEEINIEKIILTAIKIKDLMKVKSKWEENFTRLTIEYEQISAQIESIQKETDNISKTLQYEQKNTINDAEKSNLEISREKMKYLKDEICFLQDKIKKISIEDTQNGEFIELETELQKKQSLLSKVANDAMDKRANVEKLTMKLNYLKEKLQELNEYKSVLKNIKISKFKCLMDEKDDEIKQLINNLGGVL